MKNCASSLPVRAQAGFSLVEVVLALGIVTFVVVGLIGLFLVALRTSSDSAETIAASNLATMMLNQRRVAPIDGTASATSALTNFSLPSLDQSTSNFNPSTGAIVSPVYVGKDGFQTTNISDASYGLCYRITKKTSLSDLYFMLYWPPQATPETASGRYEVVTQIALP